MVTIFNANYTKVTEKSQKDHRKITEESQKNDIELTGVMKGILDLVRTNNDIKTIEIAEKLGITRETVSRNITKLRESGLIERVGSDKYGYWKVKQ